MWCAMPDSEDICERFWNLPSKPGEEARRECLFLDDVIQKAHLDREIFNLRLSQVLQMPTVIRCSFVSLNMAADLVRKSAREKGIDIGERFRVGSIQ